jgi:hypothetical protein
MVTPARPHRIEAREIPGTGDENRKSTGLDAGTSHSSEEGKGDPGMKQVYIMEMIGKGDGNSYYRGIIATSEMEARQIASLRGHMIKGIVRVEKIIEAEGEKNND